MEKKLSLIFLWVIICLKLRIKKLGIVSEFESCLGCISLLSFGGFEHSLLQNIKPNEKFHPPEDIHVRFYEVKDGMIEWEAFGDFQASDVHKQVAISFKTPRYKTLEVNII